MAFGGLFQYSKHKIMKELPTKYKVKSFYFENRPEDINFYKELLDFPFIYKPDFGERGKNVYLFWSSEEFEAFFPSISEAFILQAYCSYPIEIGVLYHRYPSGKSQITSVTLKSFLKVHGDGISTLKALVQQEIRAFHRRDYLENKFGAAWLSVPDKGQEIILEEIGNHCRGTAFLDGCDLINPALVAVFDKITAEIPHFYYGRFDLKLTSIEDLYKGENIQIFEVNGVNSEVADIYDPKHNIIYAYKKVYKELTTVFRISNELRKNKVKKPNTYGEFYQALNRHLRA